MAFVIYRVQKLARGSRGSGTLGQSLRHLSKHKESAEISKPQHTEKNFFKGCTDYKRVMRKINNQIAEHNKHHKRTFRSDAAVACEMIFSYSPDVGQNLHFALEYEKRVLQFIKEQFPTFQLLAIARHCDENSFHWHVVATSWDEEKSRFSVRDMVGGPAELKKQQSELGRRCADLGLKRGIPKEITQSTHTTKREFNRQQLAHVEQEAKKALEDIFHDDFDR